MSESVQTKSCCQHGDCSGKSGYQSNHREDENTSLTEQMVPVGGLVQVYRIEGMDCGSCAATLEKHMQSIPAVADVQVLFSSGKMKIAHALGEDEIIREVSKAGYKASLVDRNKSGAVHVNRSDQTFTILSGAFLLLGYLGSLLHMSPFLMVVLYGLSMLIGGFKPVKAAYYAVKSKSLDMNVLMTVAAIGAVCIGEWLEGATVVWLFAVGNFLQSKSIEKTRDSIRSLMELAPPEAWVKKGEQLVRLPVEEVAVGDVIVIKPGEKVPLDGEIVAGHSSMNEAPITGESIPVDKQPGHAVFAGTVNESGSLEVRVTKLVEDSTLAQIIHHVEEAQEKKASAQTYVDSFARVYTPVVFGLALFVMIVPPLFGQGEWMAWFYRGLELLVIACPCALVISTPVAIVSAIGNAARNGVLIKGGTFLEAAGAIDAVAMDKTGTLTEGRPAVVQVLPCEGVTERELIATACTIEEHSRHPIALAIMSYAKEQQIASLGGESFHTLVGKGAEAVVAGVRTFVGKTKLFEELGVSLEAVREQLQRLEQEGHTIVVVGTKTHILGLIAVADAVRPISAIAVSKLKRFGTKEVVMLTGDHRGTAKRVAEETGVDHFYAELMPEDKVRIVRDLQAKGLKVAMVGDGINDAPALAAADLSFAMGGAGTDAAMETADIVLMSDNLEKLSFTMTLSRKALAIIQQNIWFSIVIKLIALALILPGWLTLWMAVLSDTGAALIVIANSMRLFRKMSNPH